MLREKNLHMLLIQRLLLAIVRKCKHLGNPIFVTFKGTTSCEELCILALVTVRHLRRLERYGPSSSMAQNTAFSAIF
jgi:hypothetical protein